MRFNISKEILSWDRLQLKRMSQVSKDFVSSLLLFTADNRGYFMETYSQRDMEEAGININFVQDNQSMSTKGVLRGLHFQKHFPQTKLVRAIKGAVLM